MDNVDMDYRIEIIEDEDEGGFVAYYPDLPGCITCGETIEAVLANAIDAKKVWFEALLEQEEIAADEDVYRSTNRFHEKNREAYEMLANHDIEISEKQVEQGNVKDVREALAVDALHEIQCAFSGVADELGIKDEDDVQKLVDEIRASETISARTLSDMDQAVINLKARTVSPVIDLSDLD